ncbi:YjeF N-terminal domain-containing protein [Scheffersomyces coipomensis]|uniref:YjeF N-terminal domain-containing protein n=1 Tax=Scheffersomyces coipomensis TaxID=1788519 RepID=UPI00315CFE8D
MTDYLNYKVNLTLKDGSKPTGVITHVDKNGITLGNVLDHQQQSIPNIDILSNQISDLKVIQLPPELYRSTKKNNGNKKSRQSNNINPLDDAIIFSSKDSDSDQTPKSTINRSNTPKLKSQKGSYHNQENDPDWNGEGDGNVKSLTEFDFAASNKMFDKSTVFADFKKKDTINPHDRLVGHNKLENVLKSAASKSKKDKYEIDEMVLDSNKKDNWDNIGNTSSRRQSKFERSKSPNPAKDNTVSHTNLKLVDSLSLNPINLASPVQLLEVERLSSISYGITPSITSEIAASNLSQLITNTILGGSTRLSNKKNHNLPPLVLLLIGSSRVGSRAFATGRHLTNHGVRVLAYVINDEITDEDQPEEDSTKELLLQWNLFEHTGGKIITSDFTDLLDIINNQLDTPVELIIDALQGYDDHLEDLFYAENDTNNLNHLIKWCHESYQQSRIMSLEIPSGIDGGSGTLTNEAWSITCHWCISFGIPVTGLLLAYKNGQLDVENDDISHYLIDIGIPNKVYNSKSNLRKFDKFWYSADSIIKLDITDV